MARQYGTYKILNSLDDLTYRDTKNGFLVGKKSRLSKKRIETDPKFLLTRQTNSEFAVAARGGALIRHSISDILSKAKDGNIVPRMLKQLMAEIKTDTVNPRGKRTIQDGNLMLLKGTNLNIRALLEDNFIAPFTITIDRVAGTVTFSIPSFVPVNALKAPPAATNFKIVIAGTEMDFAAETFNKDSQSTAILIWDATPTAAINTVCSLTAGTTLPIFCYLGVVFYELVNGDYWEMSNTSFNALKIVEVNP